MNSVILICFTTALCFTRADEEKENSTEIFQDICKEPKLGIGDHADCGRHTVTIYIYVRNSEQKDCFRFYDIYLTRGKEEIDKFRVEYNKIMNSAWHIFENVTFGVYGVYIEPYCTLKMCELVRIVPGILINMSSDFCIAKEREINQAYTTSLTNEPYRTYLMNETYRTAPTSETYRTAPTSETYKTSPTSETYKTSPTSETYRTALASETYGTSSTSETYGTALTNSVYEEKIINYDSERKIIIVAITLSILLLLITGLIHLARRKIRHSTRIPELADKNGNIEVDKNTAFNIEVYVFHSYDSNQEMKRRIEILKDFLRKSSYFSFVKGIDDELAIILLNVNQWLNDVLEEKVEYGTIRRIILITSQEENEIDYDVIENKIFAAFLKKLNNNDQGCLTGYNNLFVVQLDGSLTHSVKFKNIVQRHQYSLMGESLLNHIIDLSLNLCSGLKLDTTQVQEGIRELFLKHPVRNLGNCVDIVEYV